MKSPARDRQRFFGSGRRTFAASAPGRLDVMGGIADYSGSLVLEMPIREATRAVAALRDDGILRAHSITAATLGQAPTVEVQLRDCRNRAGAVSYERLRAFLAARPGSGWSAYVFGCALVLMAEKRARLRGADLWIESAVPAGKGVSASAALEVASMAALARALGVKLGDTELPILCQQVENQVVGAPCGLMDQLTCHLGRSDRLLPILCQPARVGAPVDLPAGLHAVGIDSTVTHEVSGASYTSVRTAAFMGYTIIAAQEGLTRKALETARKRRIAGSLPYGGYLANIPVSRFEAEHRRLLPESLRGKEFLEEFGGTIDPVTEVQPEVSYNVLAATQHPIYEHHRVRLFLAILQLLGRAKPRGAEREAALVELGELMYQSHASYSACGLGSDATDRIVARARAAGPARGVYGAKITGGGSGGTVCLLLDGRKGLQAAARIAASIPSRAGKRPVVFTGSSEGCRWRATISSRG